MRSAFAIFQRGTAFLVACLLFSGCAVNKKPAQPEMTSARVGTATRTVATEAAAGTRTGRTTPARTQNRQMFKVLNNPAYMESAQELSLTNPEDPKQGEPREIVPERVVPLVKLGKYLGIAEGRIRFQPLKFDPDAPTPALLEDAVIGSTVQGKLVADPELKAEEFEIRSRGGVVQVKPTSGSCTSSSAAKVVNYALEVPGVVEVQVPIGKKSQKVSSPQSSEQHRTTPGILVEPAPLNAVVPVIPGLATP